MTAAAGSTRTPASAERRRLRVGIVGRGRVGTALAAGLRRAGHEVAGPTGRGETPAGDALLLCVPDGEIEAACELPAGAAPLVGHTSGATPLTALRPAAEAGAEVFGLHPLQTVAAGEAGADSLRGAGCGIAGSSERALAAARELALALGMSPFELHDEQRAAYHAAASIASNYLLTIEAAAEEVAAGAGIAPAEARRLLGPLVRQTVANWLAHGPEAALTGPVVRGDEATIERQREAVGAASPDALRLFDELTEATRAIAARTEVPA